MIELQLTGRQAIALHEFLANRLLMQSKQVPEAVKRELAASAFSNTELTAIEQKLVAELDNLRRIQEEVIGMKRLTPEELEVEWDKDAVDMCIDYESFAIQAEGDRSER